MVPVALDAALAAAVQLAFRDGRGEAALRAACCGDPLFALGGSEVRSCDDWFARVQRACEVEAQQGAAHRDRLVDQVAAREAEFARATRAEPDADVRAARELDAEKGVPPELHSALARAEQAKAAADAALAFATRVRSLLHDGEADCPICLEPLLGRTVSVLPCHHAFCRDCLTGVLGRGVSAPCPHCRRRFRIAETATFFHEPDRDAPARVPAKLAAMLAIVQAALQDGERVVVFAQWQWALAAARAVLVDAGAECCVLEGDLAARMDVLRRFGSPRAPRVLLLSSETYASGVNLQCARHVVLLHPYVGAASGSLAAARAFERQAVGRVRRFPQRRTVFVHRLFCVGTLEEEMYVAMGLWGPDADERRGL